MMQPLTASQQITQEVTSWPGVEAGPGRRGEFAFKVDRREIGHLHGDHAAHFSFPKAVWSDLMAQGRIEPHPVFPDRQGPAARRIPTGLYASRHLCSRLFRAPATGTPSFNEPGAEHERRQQGHPHW